MDAWWDRDECAKKENLDLNRIVHQQSAPLTIFAVNAPHMGRRQRYDQSQLHMLAKKVTLIYAAASHLKAPLICSGLLGGGAFRGNRPLVLLLHLLLHDGSQPVRFYHPVFWSFSREEVATLQSRIKSFADAMLEKLWGRRVETLDKALEVILASELPLGRNDRDLTCTPHLCI